MTKLQQCANGENCKDEGVYGKTQMLCCVLASFVGIRMTSLPVLRQTFAYSSLSQDPPHIVLLAVPLTQI